MCDKLILFSMEHEFKKSFCVICDLKVLCEPWRTKLNYYLIFDISPLYSTWFWEVSSPEDLLTHWLLELFTKNTLLGNFGDFQPGNGSHNSDLLKKAFVTWQHAFLFINTTFYEIFAQVCAEIFLIFFHLSFFDLFLSYCCNDWASTGLASRSKNFWESIIETGNFYHGVAKCSCKIFCCKFFTQILEHFHAYLKLCWDHHPDLGTSGKIYSFCRTWVLLQMMLILFKGDNIRSETKANAHRDQLWPPQESTG